MPRAGYSFGMELPDLVRDHLGSEQVQAGVALGDDDLLCLTPTRVLVYSGEGLLSDEAVEIHELDVERLLLSEGRRKTKFVFEYVDRTESLTVPRRRADKALELLMEGILDVAGVTEPEESVAGVYRFSELTLVVTDRRLVKHVGTPAWDDDYEGYPFESVTGLDFEEGSVATQIVLSVDGRPERIKAPNDAAPMLRRTLEEVLFEFRDVDSLAAFNRVVAPAEAPEDESEPDHLDLGEGIDPLVAEEPDPEPAEPDDEEAETDSPRPERIQVDPRPDQAEEPEADEAEAVATETPRDDRPSGDELAEIQAQLADLEATIEDQTDLLRKHHEAIQQLISELRKSR